MLLTTRGLTCTHQYYLLLSPGNTGPLGEHLLAGKTLVLASSPEGAGPVPWAS